jgi:hypothetical protein
MSHDKSQEADRSELRSQERVVSAVRPAPGPLLFLIARSSLLIAQHNARTPKRVWSENEFRESLHATGYKRAVQEREKATGCKPVVRTTIGTFVGNKGISTALKMRLGSTIRFGHESAAREL